MTTPLEVKGLRKRDREELSKLAPTVHDLLWRLPARYQDRRVLTPIADVRYDGTDEKVMLRLTVSDMHRIRTKRQQRILWIVTFTDGRDETKITFFNPAINRVLQPGTEVLLWGKVRLGHKGIEITSADFEVLEGENLHGFAPIYRGAGGVEARRVRVVMERLVKILSNTTEIADPVPDYIRKRRGLMDLRAAMKKLHVPGPDDDIRDFDFAKRALAYTEAWLLAAGMRLRRRGRLEEGSAPAGDPIVLTDDEHDRVVNALGHRPTPDQRRAIEEIRQDLASGAPMRRLLQGDVGSGKTMVSTYMLMATALRGHQAAMLAPTEILARQHNAVVNRAARQLDIANWLLLGSTPNRERSLAYNAFAHGYGRVIVGTHALLEPKMKFRDLRAIVIDEQHKFGVMQRQKMINKGSVAPHVLSSTATPIPRTLTLAMHGDLEVSVIRTKPPGRGPTATRLVPTEDWDALIQFCTARVCAGDQIYVVCPVVQEGVKSHQGEDADDLAAVEETAARLRNSPLARVTREIVSLHGQLPQKEKDAAMKRFVHGVARVMVSSTVVEVGVDVPEATVMVILDADRFGLTQLHQLRGRVGRGARGGVCVLVTQHGGDAALKRLKTMCATDDGFVVAEADLALRGCGEWFAERQHGTPRLRVLDLDHQKRLLEEAFEDVDELLEQDMSRAERAVLKRQIIEHFGPEFRFTGHDSG